MDKTTDAPNTCPIYGRHHHFFPASVMMQPRQHKITQQQMARPSLLLVCACSEQRHDWVIAPPEWVDDVLETKNPLTI